MRLHPGGFDTVETQSESEICSHRRIDNEVAQQENRIETSRRNNGEMVVRGRLRRGIEGTNNLTGSID